MKIINLIYTILFILISTNVWSESKDDEYVFILKGRGNVFWKVLGDGIKETAEAMSVQAVIQYTDDDQTPEAQLNICSTALLRKPKVIVMGAATKVIGIECFKQATKQGVPVADIDGNVTIEDARLAGLPMTFSVGSNNQVIGEKMAEYLKSTSNKQAPDILLIKGLPGSIVSEQRAQGFQKRIKEILPSANFIAEISADWDRMKAMNSTLDFLQRNPELNYIFSVSDIMTMGVVEGVKVAGKKESVKVLSVDGIADARKAVLGGHIEAIVAQLPYLMGKRSVELAIEAGKGQLSYYSEYTDTPILNLEKLKKNNTKELEYVR